MTTFTGKLMYVNPAQAGKKSDSIVIEKAEGGQQRIFLKLGESSSLTKHKGKVISVSTTSKTMADGTVFHWATPNDINVASGGSTGDSKYGEQTVDRNLSINYQSARKDAILALSHNTKGAITPAMLHEYTLELTKLAMNAELSKEVFKGRDTEVDDDDFELNSSIA